MAVVFISPKQRQRMFFMIITAGLLLFLTIISLGIFLSKPPEVAQTITYNQSKINIDMSIFDKEELKNLKSFADIQPQFSYIARAKNNTEKNGFISADSIIKARSILEDMGLTVLDIRPVKIGKDNPFTPYY